MSTTALPTTTPPASTQAEEALLGSLLINPELLKTINVNPQDFYILRNRWIYEAMLEIGQTAQVDYMTVCNHLENSGKLKEIKGSAYLLDLIARTPTSLHAESYAAIIRDRAQRRRILEIAANLAKSAYDLDEDVDKTVSSAATSLANSTQPKSGAQHVSIYASRHYDRMTELSSGSRQVQRIPTGFIDFDRCLDGGLRIPEMLLLLGKPGLGKTKFILQLGFQMGRNFPGAIYEMETDEDQIMDREFSRRTKILDSRFETGQLDDDEWPLYTREFEKLADKNQTKVYLDFGCNWTTTSLRADLARLKAEYGIAWYMVDYMKFLRDSYGKDEIERLNHISGRLKQINRELGLASVIIHSMNKEGIKSQNPDLSNMSQGADIAFDTDKALFMTAHIPRTGEIALPNYRTFTFQKSRSRLNHPMFHLQAVKEFPAFLDVAPEHQILQEQQTFGNGKKPAHSPTPVPMPYIEPDLVDDEDLEL
ncbi:MAG: DnaB-like helicase C-terminal domain-containing protein [Anaerolineales bacterium]|nr:DnaB-like helicase C-terminal domain-containing protein [Anaerolineales bacterium]